MSLSLYKPNAKNTGAGFSFQIGLNHKTGESVLYVKAIKQHSWDSTKKQGYFQKNIGNPDKNITIKFNEYEIGNLIYSLRSRVEYTTFHTFNDDKTIIKLAPWDRKAKKSVKNEETGAWEDEWITVPSHALSFNRNGNQLFGITIDPGEAATITEYLKVVLKRIFHERADKQIRDIKKGQNSTNSEDVPF
tara:strand:- start:3320 stop:3889 length:570 start_codon:yes stop_codon:yes gene_type:complete